MNDLQVHYFMEVVNNGVSFTRASQSLYISQPALSKHIRKLERELGITLFDTTKKSSIKLTPAGTALYKFFSGYKQKFNKLVTEVRALENQPRGELKAACLEVWNLFEILPGAKNFNSRFPYITSTFESVSIKETIAGVLNNSYDLAVTAAHFFEGIENIAKKEIYSGRLIFLFSKNHKLAQKTNLQIIDFKDDTFYELNSIEDSMARNIHDSFYKSQGFIPKVKTLPNFNSIIQAVEGGDGGVIVDQAARIKNNTTFKYLTLDSSVTISAVWKKDNPNHALNLFINEYLT